MPAIQKELSVPLNGQIDNMVAGSAFEIARQRQLISMGVTAAATGTFFNIQSGSDVVVEESPTFIKTQFPIVPDEMYYNDIQEAVDRLRIFIRNTTGAAIVARCIVLGSPV